MPRAGGSRACHATIHKVVYILASRSTSQQSRRIDSVNLHMYHLAERSCRFKRYCSMFKHSPSTGLYFQQIPVLPDNLAQGTVCD
jgi:hypothetical protein